MEDTAEVRVGTFVWTIGDFFSIGGSKNSPEFKFGKYDCYLDINEYDEGTSAHSYRVDLNESNLKTISYKTFCKLCLIDGHGKECEKKQTTLAKAFSRFVPLMTISKYDLNCKDNYQLSESVSLRLSWCDKGNSSLEQGTQTAPDLNSVSEEEPRKFLETLSEDLGRFYENKVDTDFLLRVGEEQIPAHRAVLSARSEVFAAMFRHDTSENRSGVVEIPDVDASVLRDVLYYVYSGQARGMSADTICRMYEVADKYALIELRDLCLEFLMRSLTVENVCDAALLAHTHGETKLEEEVVQFVKEKLEEIEATEKWKEFLNSKSSLAFKLIRSTLMIYRDKDKSLSSK